jgi:tRNA nucleotidyltransferase (CCA-adding enzyme)
MARLGPGGNAEIAGRLDALAKLAVIIAFRDPIEIADLAIDGEDLQRAGIQNGPQMGKVLKALLDRVIENPALNTNSDLLALAKSV